MRVTDSDAFTIGRYAVYGEIAAGGMATVHLGRLVGQVGFSRTVAIKRLHAQFAKDPDFVAMFIDEARVAGRIRHPNVVPILDIIQHDDELCIVMEYVAGASLSQLLRAAAAIRVRLPLRIVAAITIGVLEGLQAAHDAVSEFGEPLGIVHRDVSPQNIQVGVDGLARVLDFGVAKAAGRLQTTREGQIKGKLAYMAPEQLRGLLVDRRTDVYAMAAVLWEALTGKRLFEADSQIAMFGKVLDSPIRRPTEIVPDLPHAVEELVMRGLERDPTKRFQSAEEMAEALEKVMPVASPREVGRVVDRLAAKSLRKRSAMLAEIESTASQGDLAQLIEGVGSGKGVVTEALERLAHAAVNESEPDIVVEADIVVEDLVVEPGMVEPELDVPEPLEPSQITLETATTTIAKPVRRQRLALGAAVLGIVGLGAALWAVRSSTAPALEASAAAATSTAVPSGEASAEAIVHEPPPRADGPSASASASSVPQPDANSVAGRTANTRSAPHPSKTATPTVPPVSDFGGRE